MRRRDTERDESLARTQKRGLSRPWRCFELNVSNASLVFSYILASRGWCFVINQNLKMSSVLWGGGGQIVAQNHL